MKGFGKNKRGAITVMITLLLIPALLFSGSGVDIARIYTARSIMQTANQMGANAALTQYDAMLQDIYGLFALTSEDENLNKMVTDYVNLSLYGTTDPSQATATAGALSLFSGTVSKCTVQATQYLGDIDNLRHQIEEYAKFRAPVAIAEEIIDRIKSFEKIKANAEVIKDKVYLDNLVSDMQKLCIETYDAIQQANSILNGNGLDKYIDKNQDDLIDELNALLDEANAQFNKMLKARNNYDAVCESDDLFKEEKKDEYEKEFNTYLQNLYKIARGNNNSWIKSWKPGDIDDNGEWEEGTAKNQKKIKRSLESLSNAVVNLQGTWEGYLDTMVKKCEDLDRRASQIDAECDRLKAKVDSGQCDEDLAKAIREHIAAYKELTGFNGYELALEVSTHNRAVIQRFVDMFKNIGYGRLYDNVKSDNANFHTYISLGGLENDDAYSVDVVQKNKTLQNEMKKDAGKLVRMAGYRPSEYYYKLLDKYALFNNESVFSSAHRRYYDQLSKIAQEGKPKEEENITNNIMKFLQDVKKRLEGLYKYTTQGANYYKNDAGTGDTSKQFGMGGSWNDKDGVMKEMDGALDQVTGIVSGLDQISRKVLLVAYASEMFSCYTDPNTAEEPDAERRITLSGVPMDTNINYFYRAELEYLYNGNLGSTTLNLMAVSGTILLIRFVFNYIATFTVESVRNTIKLIRDALMAIPVVGSVVGIAVSELARVAFALGESVVDVMDLRNGEAVPLMKNQDTWQLCLVNFVEKAAESKFENDKKLDDVEKQNGLYYIDYLRIFLLLKDGNVLTERVESLIELNVTNAKNTVYQAGTEIKGHESEINKVPYFELDKQAIGVTVSTTVDLRFLFFSMGYFQDGINGVRPAKSTEITVVDYRGY